MVIQHKIARINGTVVVKCYSCRTTKWMVVHLPQYHKLLIELNATPIVRYLYDKSIDGIIQPVDSVIVGVKIEGKEYCMECIKKKQKK